MAVGRRAAIHIRAWLCGYDVVSMTAALSRYNKLDKNVSTISGVIGAS